MDALGFVLSLRSSGSLKDYIGARLNRILHFPACEKNNGLWSSLTKPFRLSVVKPCCCCRRSKKSSYAQHPNVGTALKNVSNKVNTLPKMVPISGFPT